ncbi:uncharacterized protein LOC110433658 [Sorghum bicolor]|uniref:uncharacterized protein LOC110433658 n=1 Tax=Sorghum bicolor TaxID=4558 RepID=UPI000B424959|nr:uncharacterized protein LOC110433658 [Sorghum bicolor]|eukprot:XP_021311835.1 uncharacterized protein LOC110433658 [Sorghum bicolor]
MKYAGSRVGADIRAAMVGGDGRRGGGLCAARSGDGVGVGYRIGDCGSMPSDNHWLDTMDGGDGEHGPSPWSGHLGRGGAAKARTGTGGAGGVGALDGGAAGRAAVDTTERRDGGATFALLCSVAAYSSPLLTILPLPLGSSISEEGPSSPTHTAPLGFDLA